MSSSTGPGPYKKLGENAPKIAEGIRSLMEFNAASMQTLTWESTGIKTYHDPQARKFTSVRAAAVQALIQKR